MAQAISQEKSEQLKQAAANAIEKKIISQEKQGKTFKPTGAGVIPEKVWKNLAGKQEAQNG